MKTRPSCAQPSWRWPLTARRSFTSARAGRSLRASPSPSESGGRGSPLPGRSAERPIAPGRHVVRNSEHCPPPTARRPVTLGLCQTPSPSASLRDLGTSCGYPRRRARSNQQQSSAGRHAPIPLISFRSASSGWCAIDASGRAGSQRKAHPLRDARRPRWPARSPTRAGCGHSPIVGHTRQISIWWSPPTAASSIASTPAPATPGLKHRPSTVTPTPPAWPTASSEEPRLQDKAFRLLHTVCQPVRRACEGRGALTLSLFEPQEPLTRSRPLPTTASFLSLAAKEADPFGTFVDEIRIPLRKEKEEFTMLVDRLLKVALAKAYLGALPAVLPLRSLSLAAMFGGWLFFPQTQGRHRNAARGFLRGWRRDCSTPRSCSTRAPPSRSAIVGLALTWHRGGAAACMTPSSEAQVVRHDLERGTISWEPQEQCALRRPHWRNPQCPSKRSSVNCREAAATAAWAAS